MSRGNKAIRALFGKAIFQRPSKRYFFTHLRADLATVQSGVVLDAASADMINYSMFRKGIRYVGVDIDRSRLASGKKQYPEIDAVEHDISQLDQIFAKSSVDAIVSTNTFEHLDAASQIRTIKHFYALLKDGGTIIFNKHKEGGFDAMMEYVTANFDVVKEIAYKNSLSKTLEKSRNNRKGHYIIPYYRFDILVLGKLAYWSEFFTRSSGSVVYCVAKAVKTDRSENPFVMNNLIEVDGIYIYRLADANNN